MSMPGTGAYTATMDGPRLAYHGNPPMPSILAPAAPVTVTAAPPPPPPPPPPVVVVPPPRPKVDPPPGVAVIQGQADGSMVVLPLPPGVGGDDSAVINAAALQAGGAGGLGGVVLLGPYNYNCQSEIVLPQQSTLGVAGGGPVSLIGVPGVTRLMHNFTGTLVYMHRTSNYGAQFGLPAQSLVGALRGVILDGTNAGAGSIGLDVGDGWGYDIDIAAVNYTQATQIAVNAINRVVFTEKGSFRLHLLNNQNPLVLDTAVPSISHEYCDWLIYLFAQAGQNGIVIQGGASTGGSSMRVRGNMSKIAGTNNGIPPNSAFTGLPLAAVTILGNNGSVYSSIDSTLIDLALEGNTGVVAGDTYPYAFYLQSSNQAVSKCQGLIRHSLNGAGATPGVGSVLNGAEFTFRGLYTGDTVITSAFPGPPGSGTTQSTQPAVPGSGVLQQNYGPDFVVNIGGGTVSQIQVNGFNTGVVSGTFFINSGGSLKLTYTVAPTTYQWVPAATTQY